MGDGRRHSVSDSCWKAPPECDLDVLLSHLATLLIESVSDRGCGCTVGIAVGSPMPRSLGGRCSCGCRCAGSSAAGRLGHNSAAGITLDTFDRFFATSKLMCLFTLVYRN